MLYRYRITARNLIPPVNIEFAGGVRCLRVCLLFKKNGCVV